MWSVSRRLPPAEAAPSVELAGRLSPRSADRVRAQRLSSLRVRAQRRRLRPCCACARMRGVGSHFVQFATGTTMHGLRYLAEPRRPWHERLLWAASVLLALGACATLVAQTWVRWRAAPIIVALDEGSRPIWNVPFPAVTVCPINKINASKFNFSDVSRRALHDNATDEEKLILSEILTLCDVHNENLTSMEGRDIVALIEKFAPDINETIIVPEFRRKDIAGLFRPLITEEGLCYTFNMLDRSEFFVNGTVFMSRNYLNYGLNSTEWSPVDGYSENSDEDSYPFRTTATGQAAGLTFRLDVSLCHMDSDCKDALEGHTITVHSPLEFPDPSRNGLRLPLSGGAKVSVQPVLLVTDDDLEKEYSVEQRQCYFPDERRLAYFHFYTQHMCETECLANFTLAACGCVPYFMPRFDNTEVCGSSLLDHQCVEAAKDNFQKVDFRVGKRKLGLDVESRSSEPSGERERCRCLPSCVYYGYEASATVFESKGAHWINSLRKGLCTNETYEETTSLESFVSVYFNNFYLIPLRRMERFGTIDFLANCGGLLGLCLGVSALSVVEIIYWLLVRPWYGNRNRNQSIPSL